MCSHYEAPNREQLLETFHLEPRGQYKLDLWPGYTGVMIRNCAGEPPAGEQHQAEAVSGVFGLLPGWVKDQKLARRTYNARSETVDTLNSFRTAWKHAKHCIIPAVAIYEPDWRSGKAVPTRISRMDGQLLGIAGLWEEWLGPEGTLASFTMLTINAEDHELMRNYHKPADEKRMVVILPAVAYRDWLKAGPAESREFLRQYPADRLHAEAKPPNLS